VRLDAPLEKAATQGWCVKTHPANPLEKNAEPAEDSANSFAVAMRR